MNVGDDELWLAARAAEPPTEVMPTATLDGAADNVEPATPPKEPELEVEPATSPSELAPEVEPATSPNEPATADPQPVPPAPIQPERPTAPFPLVAAHHGRPAVTRSPRAQRELSTGAVAGVLIVLVLLAGAIAVREAGFLGSTGSNTDASLNGDPTSPATGELPPDDGTVAFSCSPRELTAPAAARWRLYRAEFGPRDRFDYLRLKLRREGEHDQAATVTAEVMAPEDTLGRYGVEAPPGADVALVVAFNGSVGIGGPWDAHAGYAALRDFRVAHGDEGRVYVVAAVAGEGCFNLVGGGWEAGQMDGLTDITLEIAKR